MFVVLTNGTNDLTLFKKDSSFIFIFVLAIKKVIILRMVIY